VLHLKLHPGPHRDQHLFLYQLVGLRRIVLAGQQVTQPRLLRISLRLEQLLEAQVTAQLDLRLIHRVIQHRILHLIHHHTKLARTITRLRLQLQLIQQTGALTQLALQHYIQILTAVQVLIQLPRGTLMYQLHIHQLLYLLKQRQKEKLTFTIKLN
jgi:hypothetical protein